MQETVQPATVTKTIPTSKLALVVVILTAGLVGMLSVLAFTIKSSNDNKINVEVAPAPTITLVQNEPTFTPTQEEQIIQSIILNDSPQFTGVAESTNEAVYPQADSQAIELRQLLPIEDDNINITFDYETDQFVFSPKSATKNIDVRKWLDDKGFTAIQLEKVRVK